MPATAFNRQPAYACAHTRSRHCVISLSEGGEASALAARTRRAALAVVGPCSLQGHYTSERHLPFGATPCSDMPAAASNKQPACACAHTRSRHCARSLSGGGAAHALATRARRAILVVLGPLPLKGHITSERPLPYGAKPCSDVKASTSNEQLACACAYTRSRHYARSLSVGDAARALAARPRRAALVVVVPYRMEGHCSSEKALSFGARPCSDVPAAAFLHSPLARVRTRRMR